MYYCYILKSINPEFPNHTYVGMTVNPERRIRQHNGELVGGAKATKAHQPHFMFCIVSGFPTIHDALSYEWHIKHPTGKKRVPKQYSGIIGRVKGLRQVLETKKPEFNLTIKIEEQYKNLLENIIIADNFVVEVSSMF